MSTRAQILVACTTAGQYHDVLVYRHSDGYPDGPCGVLAWLLPVAANFIRHRGLDPEYLTAHIAAASIRETLAGYAELRRVAQQAQPDLFDEATYAAGALLGNGVRAFTGLFNFNGDVAYIYVVRETHVEIRVPKAAFWDMPTLDNTRLHRKASLAVTATAASSLSAKRKAKTRQAAPEDNREQRRVILRNRSHRA